uniref:Uncharacterized protein n=1 Tax=Amphimedon queenslandica TaxID=400682 RepID=A0A1X7SY21_AMPQE
QSSQAELMLETLTAVYEKEILHAIIDLNIEFSSLVMHVQLGLEEKIKNDSDMLQTFTTWLETHMHWNDKLTSISLDEIFRTIDLFYDFIDCSLIVEMSDIFLQDFKFGVKELSIVSELKTYKIRADELQLSAQVEDLHESLPIIYQGHIPDTSNMRMISIKLHNQWESSKMNGLSLLIHNLLPVGHQQSIMKYITICITSEYVNLEYFVHGYTTDSLIDYTRKKLQFMHLIGIFSLYINDHPVFQEDENMNFTFELALVNAVTAGNNEAVELLLQLGCIDDTNKEGETALMLACKRGHEDTVHSLLSAGANVDIEDNKGWTALMIANEHNHISIIHMLLQANANPHLKTSDRSNAVMIASYHGNYEIVELLISKRVDYNCQREDGANAFMLACKSGHTQIVKFLLKEQVDPNVQMKDGANAFMLACQNGHIQIVKLLLKKKVNPNVQRNDGMNALMLACKNGHTKIVELLLKEQVDPNVQRNDGTFITALTLARHDEIVQLLLKSKAVKKGNLKEDDAASVYSFESHRTVSSGRHTVSDNSSSRTFPSTLTLDSGIEELTDKK